MNNYHMVENVGAFNPIWYEDPRSQLSSKADPINVQDEGLGIPLQPLYHRPMQERTTEGSRDVEG